MKKRYLKWICILVLTCTTALFLMGAAEGSEAEAVKRLLEKRTVIMENVLFDKITYDEGKRQLKEVEKDKLYNDDIRRLAGSKDTDIEAVNDMDIIDIRKESHIYDIMTFCCSIRWSIEGIGGISEETYEYIVGAEVKGGEYRLVSFELKKEE